MGAPINWPGLDVLIREAVPTSPQGHFANGDRQITVDLYFPWDQMANYTKTFLGFPRVFDDGHFRQMVRFVPAQHPTWRNEDAALWCDSISFQGFVPAGKDADGVAAFNEGRVGAHFRTPPYRVLRQADMLAIQNNRNWTLLNGAAGGPLITWDNVFRAGFADEATGMRYTSWEFEPRARYQTVPSLAGFRWGPLPFAEAAPAALAARPGVTQTAAVVIMEGRLSVTWHQIPLAAVPWDAIAFSVGRCNLYRFGIKPGAAANDLRIPFGPFNPGTLLCLAPRITPPHPLASGDYGVDITYLFDYYPAGCNFLWRHDLATLNRGFYPFSRDGRTFLDPVTGDIRASPIVAGAGGPGIVTFWPATLGPPPPNNADSNELAFPPADHNMLFRPHGSLGFNAADGTAIVYVLPP